jgi:hypothetical protein
MAGFFKFIYLKNVLWDWELPVQFFFMVVVLNIIFAQGMKNLGNQIFRSRNSLGMPEEMGIF